VRRAAVRRARTAPAALALLALLVGAARAGDPSSRGRLTVVVDGFESAAGQVLITVYDSSDSFLGTRVAARSRVVPDPETVGDGLRVTFGLPQGEYAVSVFHDVDGDGELASDFFGSPREPYGFSNNARGWFGPPSFEAARIRLGVDPQEVRITLR
jgi:uncharacterized protein (DUF2141 family)